MKTFLLVVGLLITGLRGFSQIDRTVPAGSALTSGATTRFLDQISVDNGLSQSEVFCVLKDSQGYVWFGTQDGLNRYDGYQITHFKHNPFDSTTLSHDHIISLCEDKRGNVWVGTLNGLNRYDPATGRFRRCGELIRPVQGGYGLTTVNALVADSFGTLWVGTTAGLKRLVFRSDLTYTVVPYAVGNLADRPGQIVSALLIDGQGTLWLGTARGVARMPIQPPASVRKAGAEFVRPRRVPGTLGMTNWVKTMALDHFGSIWVGTMQGVERIDPKLGTTESYPEISRWTAGASITSLLIDRKNMLWVGTNQAGICRFRVISEQHIRYLDAIREDLFSKKGLKTGAVYTIYEGPEPNEDVVWIGTHGAGVQLYSRSKNSFRQWPLITSRSQSAATNLVFAVCTDPLGNLWVGTHEGLLCINRLTRATRHFRANPNDPYRLESDQIECLRTDRQGTLWVGTITGLYRYDPRQNRFYKVLPKGSAGSSKKGSDRSDGVLSLYEDRVGNLWVGGYSTLRRIDVRTGQVTTYAYDSKNPNSLKAFIVYAIQEGPDGQLWVGTGFGLNKINLRTGQITHLQNNPKDPQSLIGDQVMGFLRDHRNQFWVCSNKGFSRVIYRQGRERFIHYTERDGLPNEMVYGALEDAKGHIWMSTNLGLSCFDPITKRFRNYDDNDGLTGNEFNMNAYHQSPDGELFFGGIGMLVSFNPLLLTENQHQPRTVLTSFKKFEKPVNVDSLLAATGKLEIRPDENFFSFSFAALDYTNPHKNQYAYQLEGFQDAWIYSGTRRYVSFTNLKPGNYVLKIKGSNSEGLWNDRPIAGHPGAGHPGAAPPTALMLRIPITVLPPFWQTWWFLALVLTGTLGLVWLTYNYRVRKRVAHLLELERVKLAENERVRKLAAQDLHDEFGNTITRISMLTEIIKSKMNGHGEEISPLLTKISDNSNRLYQGTKDFIWAINPEHDNFLEIAIRLKDFGEDVFDRTPITFQAVGIQDDLRRAVLPVGSSRHLIFLFKEAMSNTLKHSRATSAQVHFALLSQRIEIQWKDNGVGIQDEPMTGNGLHNIRSRAGKIGGKVEITSAPLGGTTILFRMDIPQIG